MTRNRLASDVLAALTLTAVAASTAFAQDPAAPERVAAPPSDYRWAIYTSCTVVFAAMVVYMVVTHNRAASVAGDLASIESRLDELESGDAKK